MKITKNDEEKQGRLTTHVSASNGNAYNVDKMIVVHNERGYFNNGGFFTAFSDAFKEIATNKQLNKLDKSLLLLLLSYMGIPDMMVKPNVQRLLGIKNYADELRNHKQHISKSFFKLEEMGYIRRDKKKKDLHLLINPAMAYNGKTKDYTKVWNQLSFDFGNDERQYTPKEDEEKESQDWNSNLPSQLKDRE